MPKALWIALIGGVMAWAAHLLVSYLLADLGCRGDTWALLAGRHLVTLAAAIAVVAVTLTVRPYLARPAPGATAMGTQVRERHFLAYVALTLNAIFLFAIVMAGSTSLFLVPCM